MRPDETYGGRISDSRSQFESISRVVIGGVPISMLGIGRSATCGSSSSSGRSRSSSLQMSPSGGLGFLNTLASQASSLTAASTAAATILRYAFGKVFGTCGPRTPSSLISATACFTIASRRSWNGPSLRGTEGMLRCFAPE